MGKRRCADGEESIKFEGAPLRGKGIIRCLNRAKEMNGNLDNVQKSIPNRGKSLRTE